MSNTLAAKVLISHLPEITDGAYKTATEIAIETLLLDAVNDWYKSNCELSAFEYLGITEEEYDYWVLGMRNKKKVPVNLSITEVRKHISKFDFGEE